MSVPTITGCFWVGGDLSCSYMGRQVLIERPVEGLAVQWSWLQAVHLGILQTIALHLQPADPSQQSWFCRWLFRWWKNHHLKTLGAPFTKWGIMVEMK